MIHKIKAGEAAQHMNELELFYAQRAWRAPKIKSQAEWSAQYYAELLTEEAVNKKLQEATGDTSESRTDFRTVL